MKILVVEDDELTARALETVLSHQNYAVEMAGDADSAWELIEIFDYDLVLLDVLLPGMDGVTLCRQIRANHYQMPLMLLTAKDSSHDKALGLDAGADDYVTKPFDPEELMARVRALLRRGGTEVSPRLEWGLLCLDPDPCEVYFDGKLLPLTPKEYALLELFMRSPRRVFSCGMVIEHLWTYDDTPGEDAVRTHIKCVRQKLKKGGAVSNLIETVYGIGYRLGPMVGQRRDEPKQSGQKQEDRKRENAKAVSVSEASEPVSTGSTVAAETAGAIAKIWLQFQPRITGQIDQMGTAIEALAQGQLNEDSRHQAERNAHSLKGALGMFGLPKGSEVAAELERQWAALEAAPNSANNDSNNGSSIDIQVPKEQSSFLASVEHNIAVLRQTIAQKQTPSSNAQTGTTPRGKSEGELDPDGNPERSLVEPREDWPEEKLTQLLVIDGESAAITGLEQEAQRWNVQIVHATSLAKARKQCRQTPPDAILFDPAIVRTSRTSLKFLADINQQWPGTAVLIWTAQASLQQRLTLAQQGRYRFLDKSLPMSQVLESVDQALRQTQATEGCVLAVDDDPVILTALQKLLQPWGVQVETLDDPRQFFEALEKTTPDLVILDLKMPHVSGIELCQLVRNDERWHSLSVLCLTAQTDPELVGQVFAAGADDFVRKPIVGPELVVRVINRLERTKLLKRLLDQDPLTGLLNQRKSSMQLEQQLSLAQQQQQPFCLALVDVNGLRLINREYGHAVGDGVLRQLGQGLQQAFGKAHIVARWGGEEFVMGLLGIEAAAANAQVLQVLQQLQQQGIPTTHDSMIHPRFSLGTVQASAHTTDLSALYQEAEQAMHANKAKAQLRADINPQ